MALTLLLAVLKLRVRQTAIVKLFTIMDAQDLHITYVRKQLQTPTIQAVKVACTKRINF